MAEEVLVAEEEIAVVVDFLGAGATVAVAAQEEIGSANEKIIGHKEHKEIKEEFFIKHTIARESVGSTAIRQPSRDKPQGRKRVRF